MDGAMKWLEFGAAVDCDDLFVAESLLRSSAFATTLSVGRRYKGEWLAWPTVYAAYTGPRSGTRAPYWHGVFVESL